MKIGIASEAQGDETRVALTPSIVPLLLKDGHEVIIEAGAGTRAHLPDALYTAAAAQVTKDVQALYELADVVFRVQPPGPNAHSQRHEADMLREGAVCIGLLAPLTHVEVVERLARRRITSYALEFIPRISRAQDMDALTSMATLAGYKAVLLAANRLDRILPLMMTAAGTLLPATVLVLGAGVAGLQAIATAKRLGARVEAFDPRPIVREQVQSLGATCLDMELNEDVEAAGGYAREQSDAFLQRERDIIANRLPQADIVVCTAQVFGRRAPLLITTEMVHTMHPGAVLVDLAADQGGNCALTQPDVETVYDGVVVIGASNLPALVPFDASQLFAHNVVNLFRYLYPHAAPRPDSADEIVSATCITRDGAIVHPAICAAAQQTSTQQGALA